MINELALTVAAICFNGGCDNERPDPVFPFTVTGLDLQSNSTADEAAPQDAFEVALLNANTGLPIMASTGIQATRSDALLNIQRATSALDAPLNERAASSVSHRNNLDGSRTYIVNLSGIAANTAVNLSFDLIGFGNRPANLGSQVGIRDVRLISSPLATPDEATVAEDGSTSINVKANDLNSDAPGFALQLVASAQHGQVQLLADGDFKYTPQANYFGPDSFTYRYSDGTSSAAGLSEIATVSIHVTPVNDAPVAPDVSVTTAEDNSVTINLIAADADNTPASLQFAIQTAPQNGTLTRNADGNLLGLDFASLAA